MAINESYAKIIRTINRLKTPIRVFVIDGSDEKVIKAKAQIESESEYIEVILGDDLTMKTMSEQTRNDMMHLFKERTSTKLSDYEREQLLGKVEYVAMLLYLLDKVDAVIGGAAKSVVETINAAYRVLGPKVPNGLISTFTWLNKESRSLFFADTHFLPDPSAEMMAKIAYDTSVAIATNFHIRPSVAMISYSTDGSGGNANTDQIYKVRLATKMAQDVGLETLGEIQIDAAFDETTLHAKMPGVVMTQKPNIYVFPNLTAANSSLLTAKELGKWSTVGPLINGLNGVVNCVMKTSSVYEIVYTIAISAFISLNSRDITELQGSIANRASAAKPPSAKPASIPKAEKVKPAPKVAPEKPAQISKADKKAAAKAAKYDAAMAKKQKADAKKGSSAVSSQTATYVSSSAEVDELKPNDLLS